MTREICLDTETTGLDPKTGHRLIEIACIEIEDFIPTGRSFHRYINPDRDIDPEAEKVHGISRKMLNDKPRFNDPEVVDAFLEFVGDAPLVAHNAAFDRGFINFELNRFNKPILPDPRWICTYELAKSRFPGAYNSLDALCKRFKISLAEREKHGALIDTRLLSMVYLELRGGKERALDLAPVTSASTQKSNRPTVSAPVGGYGPRVRALAPRLTESEKSAHEAFVAKFLKDKAIWNKFAPAPEQG
jgi:DNA polymerase-3 subunit epsilon